MRGHRRHYGLTLAETLIASVLLLTTAVAVTQALVAGHVQAEDAWHRARAIELAQSLLEEVVRLPFNDLDGISQPGPESGETTRSAFDNLDDFHNFSEAGELADASGELLGEAYQDFARSVTVTASTPSIAGLGSPFAGLTITVSVQDPAGRRWAVSTFVPEPAEASP
jgi:hypothetical protein